jgi:type VII secretion integral membrane protein EccD
VPAERADSCKDGRHCRPRWAIHLWTTEFGSIASWLPSAVMAAADEMCQVSIRTTDHEVDITLPAHIPVGELMPTVIDLIDEGGCGGHDPHLTRVCGEPLDPATTLAQCAIPDGELLILTTAAQPAPVPRFDASTAVVDAVAGLIHASRPAVSHRAAWAVMWWSAAVLMALLGSALLVPNATRHAAIGAAATLLALAGAVAAHRAHRDRTGAVGLGVLAAALAGLTGALASPGRPGLPGFLLAMSAMSSTSLLAWRLLNCAPSVFLPLAAVTMTASAATVGAVAGWWPATAAGPMLAMGSLAALAVSARLSVRSSGLATADLSDTDLEARARTARHRLTALIATSAGAAALGAVITAATTLRPVVAAAFITLVGAALLLRVCRHDGRHHAAALVVSSAIATTSLIGLCTIKAPPSTPWLCGGVLLVGAGAVCVGRRRPWRLSPAAQRVISVLDLAVGAAVVPSAAAAAGAFAALPGIGLP